MTLSATNMSEKRPLMVYFRKHFNTGTRDLVTVKFIVNVTRDLVTVNLTVNKMFLKDYSGLVKHGKMLHSTCCYILRDFGSIFLNDVCSPKLHGRANHSGTKKKNFVQEYYSAIGSNRCLHQEVFMASIN